MDKWEILKMVADVGNVKSEYPSLVSIISYKVYQRSIYNLVKYLW